MKNIPLCGACKVPLTVSRELEWETNGVISLTASPKNRMVFFESETIDRLFHGIEELIGMPIGHMVIESRSRETRRYVERALPPEVREIVNGRGGMEESVAAKMHGKERDAMLTAMRVITSSIMDLGFVYGYGDQRLGDLWDNGSDFPWRVSEIRNPYSLLFIIADNLGAIEAVEASEMQIRYEKKGIQTFRTQVYPGKHPVELKERLKHRRYDFKPGNITYPCCEECSIPLPVANRIWDMDAGTITDPETGRRMAIFGPASLDAICDDLEAELGRAIPTTVIEAMRRYGKAAWGVDNWNRDGLTFQQMTAVRGLGNLIHFEGDRNHLELKVENACFILPMVGMIQALVEMAYHAGNSSVEWEMAGDGDLFVDVKVHR